MAKIRRKNKTTTPGTESGKINASYVPVRSTSLHERMTVNVEITQEYARLFYLFY